MEDSVPNPTSPDAPHPADPYPDHAPLPLIAADVGGTFARLAWVDDASQGIPRLRGLQRYACAEHASLAAILRAFREQAGLAEARAVVAIAGVLDGDTLVNANLPWPVALQATRVDAGLAALELLNDFEAVAHAIAHVPAESLVALNGELPRQPQWPALVLGPGTGLGAAVRLDNEFQPVLASEAGHVALAPGNALELQVLARLMQRWPHVDAERVLSGTGLMNLYPCLCELRGVAPHCADPAELVAAAEAGDALASETLEVFCGWLGSVCADLAIAFGARSVYLAGGLAGHLQSYLQRGPFRERFLAKGVLGAVLEHVPVWRVEHGELGVLGAAAWYRWKHASA